MKLVQLAFGVPFSRALRSFSSSKMAIFLGGKLVGSKNKQRKGVSPYIVPCVYVVRRNKNKQRKGVSPDTPSHIIQKHYEFYLANKIKSYRYILYLIWLILKVYSLIESL